MCKDSRLPVKQVAVYRFSRICYDKGKKEKECVRRMLVFLIGGVVLIAVIIAVIASVAGAVAGGVVDEESEE